jgi:hypothetical protein
MDNADIEADPLFSKPARQNFVAALWWTPQQQTTEALLQLLQHKDLPLAFSKVYASQSSIQTAPSGIMESLVFFLMLPSHKI